MSTSATGWLDRPRHAAHAAAALVLVLLLAACGDSGPEGAPAAPSSPTPATSSTRTASTEPSPPASATPSPTTTTRSPTPTATPTTAPRGAVIGEVPTDQWNRMVDAGMARAGCPITDPSQLRRVEVDYVDFEGRPQRGELIVNADVAGSIAHIFTELFEAGFPIRRMQSVENYGGDSDASLRDDNTSAYNCRRDEQTNAPLAESPHANGRAVDINPLENPWMDPRCECWSPDAQYAERTAGPGKILENGLVWELFTAEGWIWQNIDVPDYMHFDTGYPSGPFSGRTS